MKNSCPIHGNSCSKKKIMSKIALGTWAWGAGAFGGDTVFGSKTDVETLKPVFDAAMKAGLSLWDTATAYGMGDSEHILGTLVKESGIANPLQRREDVEISTKFTPQIAEIYENSVEKMALASMERMGLDYIDIYWIHNPISAVQNHFSQLYRSSEKGGVLDYCKEHGIEFWAYMVLEQGALSGKYDKTHPLPAESDRGKKYNPVLEQLEALTSEMTAIGKKYGVSCLKGITYHLCRNECLTV